MWSFRPIPLACAVTLLSACAQPQPVYPVAGYPYPAQQQFPYPQQRQDPVRETSQQLSSVQQILQQIQNLQSTIGRF
jgi:TolA-binding protein